jgi:hypothetical protein
MFARSEADETIYSETIYNHLLSMASSAPPDPNYEASHIRFYIDAEYKDAEVSLMYRGSIEDVVISLWPDFDVNQLTGIIVDDVTFEPIFIKNGIIAVTYDYSQITMIMNFAF